ncbi:MAG: hypothetical protein ABI782_06705 [Anaerolineaceae bacterium]
MVTGFHAYIQNDAGEEIVPTDLRAWVSATKTRNYCRKDPLLDWLNLYGLEKGYEQDPVPDPRTDFRAFIFKQGRDFETAVVRHLATLDTVFPVASGVQAVTSLEACRETFEAMVRGEPIIHQGVLRNPENRTYGAPDLLIRSDVLHRHFPDALSAAEALVGAPGLGARGWHYRVVDAKFTGLKLDKHWHAASDHLEYMVQAFLYNEALGRVQGYLPPQSYLLGRGWGKGTNDAGSTNCMDRLASVPHNHEVQGRPLETIASEAVDWVRKVRTEGSGWDPLMGPNANELRPNVSNDQSFPWRKTVSRIAHELEDVTLAWQVGLDGRELAIAAGVTCWTDPGFSAAVAGVKTAHVPVLDRMLAVNRYPEGPVVWPSTIATEADIWGEPRGIEFFVDFETVSNLNDDFTLFPEQNGQPLIFMIGCGHMDDGEWRFSCFTADQLETNCEADIIERWLAHMESVRQRVAPGVERPLVFHWSPAETSSMSGALKSARARNPLREASWPEPNWFDFLNRVMKREPVIVRGPMGFGLKTVARSLKQHGLIETDWPDGVTDGLGAMVAAWWCAHEATMQGSCLSDVDLMSEVSAYNEVDCRVMMEAVGCLRARGVDDNRG